MVAIRNVKARISIGAAALGIMALTIFPSQAQAETVTKYWDGYIENTGAPVYGASVQIMRQNTPPISNADAYADTSSWVMVANTNASANQYAQTGFIELNTGQIYYFFEENDGSIDKFVFSNGQSSNLDSGGNPNTMNTSGAVGPASGYYHTYAVSWDPNWKEWTGSVDGAFTNYFWAYPSQVWGNQNEVEYLDEVHQPSYAYFFGTASNPTVFYQPQYTDSRNNTYTPSNLQPVSYPYAGYSSIQNYGGLSWDEWDTRLN